MADTKAFINRSSTGINSSSESFSTEGLADLKYVFKMFDKVSLASESHVRDLRASEHAFLRSLPESIPCQKQRLSRFHATAIGFGCAEWPWSFELWKINTVSERHVCATSAGQQWYDFQVGAEGSHVQGGSRAHG